MEISIDPLATRSGQPRSTLSERLGVRPGFFVPAIRRSGFGREGVHGECGPFFRGEVRPSEGFDLS